MKFQLIIVMLVLAATDIALSQQKPPKTFTQSDTTYGDGGTVDRTFQGGSLTSQTYKDGEGHKKEVVEHKPDGGIVYSYYGPSEKLQLTIIYDEKTHTITIARPKTQMIEIKNTNDLQATQWAGEVEEQFAKDGTIPEPWKKVTTVEAPKVKSTTIADTKYGENGTVESKSYENNGKLIGEIWKDKAGNTREVHHMNWLGMGGQAWFFYPPGLNKSVTSFSYFSDTKDLIIQDAGGQLIRLEHIDEAQLSKWLEAFETQFAKDGTVSEPWAPKTTIEQPPVYKQPKEPTTTSQPVEPKKTEPSKETPKKEEPPKTDKTSTGESGGNSDLRTSFVAPGYQVDVKTEYDLIRETVTTPDGGITLNIPIPTDWRPGQTFAGSIWLDPVGKDVREREQHAQALGYYTVTLKGTKIIQPKRLVVGTPNIFSAEFIEELAAELLKGSGIECMIHNKRTLVARSQLPFVLQPAPPMTNFSIPTLGQQGSFVTIHGPFNGIDDGWTKIGDTFVPTIAESPHSRVVWNTTETTGPSKIEITENGQTGQCPFRNVGVRVSATNLTMKRGDHATVYVTFTGLAGLNQDMPYDLVNHSPGVVSMEGGSEAKNGIVPASGVTNPTGPERGTFTDTIGITGVNPGPFTITATLYWKDTCNLPPEAMHKKGP